MKNGYFRIIDTVRGYGLKLVKARDGGEEIKGMELTAYLDRNKIDYDISAVKAALEAKEDTVVELGEGPCPAINESYFLVVSPDRMVAVIKFQAPSSSGKRVDINEVLGDLRVKKIVYGINMPNLQEHFQSEGCYDKGIVVAQGTPPRQGRDAAIAYYFNTDLSIQPTILEDGSVDYFQLNMINHCRAGEVLAKLYPADPGEAGTDIFGGKIKPRDVKQKVLKFGNLIDLSEDKTTITSRVDGHVVLVEDRVFVSDVYQVENVDLSTGNIEFTGSVQVNGNVKENMRISAGGNVIIKGVVEGAYIEAGGNIVIARGMNGMSKGVLKAGGNVICKFLENTTVFAEGYVSTESVLYSNVSAGTELNVTGRKGFITGGHVQAGKLVSVKNLGANMGNPTIVEVGVSPSVKAQYLQLQREISEIVKTIRNAQPVLMNFAEKRAKGARFTGEQLKYVADTDKMIKEKTAELNQKSEEMKKLQESFDCGKEAKVDVHGVVCAGTTIIFGEISTVLKSEYRYCRFELKDGEIKMLPL
ncbi:MAG: DUF342 domain-containing protein [Lachnospiraceae bacterium]|nr:DUF342 domain-containing protein [Lachnospiraceae bacterium]